jgi:hypothetical protein
MQNAGESCSWRHFWGHDLIGSESGVAINKHRKGPCLLTFSAGKLQMVTTRSKSETPAPRARPSLNYAELANPSPRKRNTADPQPSPTKTRTSTAASQNKRGRKSMTDHKEITALDTDSKAAPVNGAVEKRTRSPQKSLIGNGVPKPKVKGKPAHKVDTSGEFAFGGSFGSGAMMLFFPILMYYLWICSTFYGGSLQIKKNSETWLAFADRLVALVVKVLCYRS